MPHRLIVNQADFEELCGHIRDAGIVAFDTEFVSEDTYQPELCLLQFATAERCLGVDPQAIESLESWWDIMSDAETTVVVHGGQAEISFCLRFSGRSPQRLVDVQLAEGFQSQSYPLGYAALVQRVLGKRVHGTETRTDWRRRPLLDKQIQYALEDVHNILPVWKQQRARLDETNRLEWADAEFARMIDDAAKEFASEGWHKLSGMQKLRPRELAVAIELFQWRDQEASRRNRPIRRTLRDDLIIDLARRQPRNRKDLLSTRDMNRSGYKRSADDLLLCIERGLALPKSELPEFPGSAIRTKAPDEKLLGKLLGIALANRCAELNVARQLVGTTADLEHLARWHLAGRSPKLRPRLLEGWRAEVCGDLLTDLLDGKISLRVADPHSDHPLVFERTRPS
jgi:ribonuclease D